MNKIPPIYTFYKEDGKWKHKLNAEFPAYMFQTCGFPFEMTLEELQKTTLQQRLIRMKDDWVTFCKENNISEQELNEIKESNEINKDELIKEVDYLIDQSKK